MPSRHSNNPERIFLRITTPIDRRLIADSIAILITHTVSIREFVRRLVMRRLLAKNFFVAIGTFLALLLIYLALRFFWA